ncbi:hypothetical protein DWB68_00230 [Galactobacter valiniphilus]|uniref:Uncharacterized protein n=1 Tax=Galactobacter valiniphilus TaxID=2676122 RepID=A0A399JHR7_9MICC|nr:hypothetical protein DWB68_00230 [Galactobacter valiniphilus]
MSDTSWLAMQMMRQCIHHLYRADHMRMTRVSGVSDRRPEAAPFPTHDDALVTCEITGHQGVVVPWR